jgi:hypothetical protein
MLKPVQRLLNTKIAAANSSETSVTFNKRHGVTLQKTLISVSTATWTSSDVREKASSLACWLAFLLRTEFDSLVTMWSRDPLAIWFANFANICAFLMILHDKENISLKSINLFGLWGSVTWVHHLGEGKCPWNERDQLIASYHDVGYFSGAAVTKRNMYVTEVHAEGSAGYKLSTDTTTNNNNNLPVF